MSSSELGYVIDFLGSFFIIQSLILRSKAHIKKETNIHYGGAPFLYEAQLKSFWDGWIGIFLFFIGLLLHLIHYELSTFYSIIIVCISIVFPLIFRFLIRYKITKDVHDAYPNFK